MMKKMLLTLAIVMLAVSPAFALVIGESTIVNVDPLVTQTPSYVDWAVMSSAELNAIWAAKQIAGVEFDFAQVQPGIPMTWLPSEPKILGFIPTNPQGPGIPGSLPLLSDPYYIGANPLAAYPGQVNPNGPMQLDGTQGGLLIGAFTALYPSQYIYFYQLENDADPNGLQQATIKSFASDNILAMGFLMTTGLDPITGLKNAVDLDVLTGGIGHEGYTLLPNGVPSSADVSFGYKSFNASFGGAGGNLPLGFESSAVFIVSDMPPTTGSVTVEDNGFYRGQVPVPSPEPASMILMGIGLAGAARLRRRTA